MAPNDESHTTDETRHNVPGATGTGAAYPAPHQAGPAAIPVNPFHLAIAELQADTDDMDLAPPPAPANDANANTSAAPARQTIVLTQPIRSLTLGHWIAIAAIALPCGLIGGLIIAGATGSKPSKPVEQTPVPDPAVVQDLEQVKSRTGDLFKRVDALNQKLAALPAPAPPPDLSGLQGKLEELTRKTAELSATGKQIAALEQNAKALMHDVESLGSEAKALQAKLNDLERTVKDVAARPAPAPAITANREEKPAAGPTLSQGADLFKRGRYKDALGIFNKLELLNPDDARVWYFAALSQGLATNQWGGGTAALVQKGIERERAGSPEPAQIDAAFKDLTVSSGKEWLEQYRKRAR